MTKLFWVDNHQEKTYSNLYADLKKIKNINNNIWEKDTYQVFLRIIHSMIMDYPIILFDGDFSAKELFSQGYRHMEKQVDQVELNQKLTSCSKISDCIKYVNNWSITLLTSGTTGIPKKVTHYIESITKACKVDPKHRDDIWGFAYNPTHMAGIQVFFQVLFNENTMINLFRESIDSIQDNINKYQVSHISATPTFYRLMIKDGDVFPEVVQISSGGEKLTDKLLTKISKIFPHARIKNIYASTEAGSIFASEGENFRIPERFKTKIKIENNELVFHKNILGESDSLKLKGDWYYSGDMIEFVNDEETIFKIIARKNEMINVGGYKVNPQEVEEALLNNHLIYQARVYGKSNPVLGNILCADIVSEELSEKEIRKNLKLQNFKIPRIINFKNNIDMTRTGKVKR